jgi:hypothetical protein
MPISTVQHKIVKRQNGKQSFCPLFAWSQLDFSATSDSVSAVSLTFVGF